MPPPITTTSAACGRSSDRLDLQQWRGHGRSLPCREISGRADRQPVPQFAASAAFYSVAESNRGSCVPKRCPLGWTAGRAAVVSIAYRARQHPLCCEPFSRRRPMKLDRIDIKILHELQKNGRITNVELAELVHLSPSPCLMRVKKLQSEGYIAGYSAQINIAQARPDADGVHRNHAEEPSADRLRPFPRRRARRSTRSSNATSSPAATTIS